MPQLHSLLILGATGRVGAAVVFALRQRYPNLPITALVRNRTRGERLREIGITVIHGDLENLGLVMDLASSADIVVNSALSESISLAQAIHIGLNNRRRGARKPILLHISRTALDLHHEDPRSLQLQTKAYDVRDTSLFEIVRLTLWYQHCVYNRTLTPRNGWRHHQKRLAVSWTTSKL
ncbi:hypothetical protein FRC20_009288 [Serendipita sp. 405]|nr:hypothetical protein FRC20_009288 [Serendipita sp. 405]